MERISRNFAHLMNIYNLAKYHKANCNHADCNVSLFQLRLLALELAEKVDRAEMAEAARMIEEPHLWF